MPAEDNIFQNSARDIAGAEQTVNRAAQSMTNSLVLFQRAQKDTARAAKDFSRTLENAFVGAIIKGQSLGDVLRGLALDLSQQVLRQSLSPIAAAGGGFLASLFAPAAKGAAYAAGRITPLARGGIVSQPTFLPLRNGAALAGEAGPEAVLPLARTADGSLGVRAQNAAAQPVSVSVTINTPDAASFRASQSQIAAALQRAVARGSRNQ